MEQNFEKYFLHEEEQQSFVEKLQFIARDGRISELCDILPALDAERCEEREESLERIRKHPLYPILHNQSFFYVLRAAYPTVSFEVLDEERSVEDVLRYSPLSVLKDFESTLHELQTPTEVLDSLFKWMRHRGFGAEYCEWYRLLEERGTFEPPHRVLRDQMNTWAHKKHAYLQIYLSHWTASLEADNAYVAERYLIEKVFPNTNDAPTIYDRPGGAARFGDWVEDERVLTFQTERKLSTT